MRSLIFHEQIDLQNVTNEDAEWLECGAFAGVSCIRLHVSDEERPDYEQIKNSLGYITKVHQITWSNGKPLKRIWFK